MSLIFLHLCAVDLVVGLRSAPDDPGRLSEAQPAPDQQRVGRDGAVVVGVVELVSLEGVVVKEAIRAREKLRTGPNLTAGTERETTDTNHYLSLYF